MSQIIIKSGLPKPEFLDYQEKRMIDLQFKQAMVFLRKQSLATAIKFLSVDRLVYTRDEACPTAMIIMLIGKYSPDMYLNLNFLKELEEKALSRRMNYHKVLASVVTHELMHFLLKHMSLGQRRRLKPQTANLIWDIFINHLIYQFDLADFTTLFYPNKQHDNMDEWKMLPLMRDGVVVLDEQGKEIKTRQKTGERTIQDTFPTFFLNPFVKKEDIDPKHRDAYESIHRVDWTLEQIEDYILKHLPANYSDSEEGIVFMGNHGSGGDFQSDRGEYGEPKTRDSKGKEQHDSKDDKDEEEKKEAHEQQDLPSGVQKQAEGVLREMFTKGKTKDRFNLGHSKFGVLFHERLRVEAKKDSDVDTMMLKALQQSVRGKMLKAMGVNRTDNVKTTVFPTFEDKKDLVLIATGYIPVFYSEPINVRKGKVVIYTDVSGSMTGIKDIIYSLLLGLEQDYEVENYIFSTKLYPLTKEDLKEGIVQTTGGTDFDIWIDHLRENEYDKVLVITDGYCSVNEKNHQFLIDENKELYVIYTKGHDSSVLEPFTVESCVLNYLDF